MNSSTCYYLGIVCQTVCACAISFPSYLLPLSAVGLLLTDTHRMRRYRPDLTRRIPSYSNTITDNIRTPPHSPIHLHITTAAFGRHHSRDPQAESCQAESAGFFCGSFPPGKPPKAEKAISSSQPGRYTAFAIYRQSSRLNTFDI